MLSKITDSLIAATSVDSSSAASVKELIRLSIFATSFSSVAFSLAFSRAFLIASTSCADASGAAPSSGSSPSEAFSASTIV